MGFAERPGRSGLGRNNGTRGTGVCFNEQFLYDDTHVENLLLKFNILDAAYERPCYQLDGSATEMVGDLMHKLKREYDADRTRFGHRHALQLFFQLILITVQRSVYDRPGPRLELTNPDHRLSIAFRHLVEERFAEGWTVERYAAELAVSEKHLSAAVSATLHITPYRYIRQRMATEAGRQLLYTDRSLTEIAADFGMDPSNFNKFFRTFHGLLPAAYREEYAPLRRVEPL